MKNLILGATSVLAISVVFAAQAQTATPAIPSGSGSKPAVSAPTSTPTPTPQAPNTAPLQKLTPAPTAKMKPVTPPQKHHVKHHKHHVKRHHMAAPQDVYITFPPAQGCNLEYYQGEASYSYVYHGGYFWYPHTQANVIPGYAPSNWNGSYWYASRMHPHVLYAEGQGASYVVPLMSSTTHPMQPLYQGAPVAKSMMHY